MWQVGRVEGQHVGRRQELDGRGDLRAQDRLAPLISRAGRPLRRGRGSVGPKTFRRERPAERHDVDRAIIFPRELEPGGGEPMIA